MTQDTSAQIHIQKLSSKGHGVGFYQKNGASSIVKVEVPFTAPEDVVQVQLGKKRKGFYKALLQEVLIASPDRVKAPCIHATSCGGCSTQQISYAKQLKEKQAFIERLFSSLCNSENIAPILPCRDIWGYRNKMEYSFSQDKEGRRFLGLMMAGSKGKVQNLSECHLTSPWFIQVLQGVYAWWGLSDLSSYHMYADTGALRTLILREGKRTNHKMVMLTVSGNPEFALKKEHLTSFVETVQAALTGETVSIFLRIQQAIKGKPTQFYEMLLEGPDHIVEELHIQAGEEKVYHFKISPTAFFQPNPLQAEMLYSKALEIAGLHKRKSILDLYAGTSTLGMIFAPFAEKVLSIEINPYAVFDGESNRELNDIHNLQILKGDVGEVLQRLQSAGELSSPDLIVLDPPRPGLTDLALQTVQSCGAKEILYISCNPATQARDCAFFSQHGYEIVKIQPVDQFPHTVHIENIILLRRS